jgi:hypothetical protein
MLGQPCVVCKGPATLMRFFEGNSDCLCDRVECDRKWRDRKLGLKTVGFGVTKEEDLKGESNG